MKVPRYEKFVSSSTVASEIKRRVKRSHTRAELLIRQELWARGYRYRLHVRGLPGCPDLVFRERRVIVFVDGDFWHGRNWSQRKTRLAAGSNAEYWLAKIGANRARDRKRTSELRRLGWFVVRLWETDVLKDITRAADLVEGALRKTSVEND